MSHRKHVRVKFKENTPDSIIENFILKFNKSKGRLFLLEMNIPRLKKEVFIFNPNDGGDIRLERYQRNVVKFSNIEEHLIMLGEYKKKINANH